MMAAFCLEFNRRTTEMEATSIIIGLSGQDDIAGKPPSCDELVRLGGGAVTWMSFEEAVIVVVSRSYSGKHRPRRVSATARSAGVLLGFGIIAHLTW